MRLIIFLSVVLFANSVHSKENCRKLTKATFFQGVVKTSVSKLDENAGMEQWQILYGISVDEYKKSRVSEDRQKQIAKEIIEAKLTENPAVNAFLISNFYYAHCFVDPEQRRYEKISDSALSDLRSCWNDPAMKTEKKRRKCFVAKMKKP